MKWLVSLFLTATAVCAQLTNREFVLDPRQVVRVPVAQERLTTFRFPGPISDLEGVFISPSVEPPARFQMSFRPGSEFFSLRALTTNASATLAVGWRGNTYHLECFESAASWPGVIFISPPAALPPAPVLPAPRPVSRATTPNRLLDMVATAQLYERLQKLKPPLQLLDVQRRAIRARGTGADFDLVLNQIFHFKSEDTLVFELIVHNKTSWPLYYNPQAPAVTLGAQRFPSSVISADGVVPARASSTIYFGITGGVNGTPAGLSPDISYALTLERTNPPPMFLPSKTYDSSHVVPYR